MNPPKKVSEFRLTDKITNNNALYDYRHPAEDLSII